jgi:hypothetical protein
MEFTKEKHDTLLDWLSMNLIKTRSINYKIDTAMIRKAFMHRTSIYVDNIAVNSVMFELGYHAANFSNDPYLSFNVSSQSPALQIYRTEVLGPH